MSSYRQNCRTRPDLQDLLVFLCMSVLHLLRRLNVVLEVSTSMFPCLKTLGKEPGDLLAVSAARAWKILDHYLAVIFIGDRIVFRPVGHRSRRQTLLRGSHCVGYMERFCMKSLLVGMRSL